MSLIPVISARKGDDDNKYEQARIYIRVGVIMLLAAGASVCFGVAFSVSLLIAAGIVFGFIAIVAFCMAAQNPSENLSVNIPYHSGDCSKEQGKRAQAGDRISEQARQTQAAAENDDVQNKGDAIVPETAKERIVRRGDVFYCRTNADLLNKLFGKHFAGFMKCHYPLTETYEIMLHEFDKVTTAKWLNQELSDGTVLERFVGDVKVFWQHDKLPEKHRALFEKRKKEGTFVFKGVYRLYEGSTIDRRVWERIADETSLYDF